MSFKAKKRFIAGAVCPRCAAMDTLRIYREGDRDYRDCIACGFSDELHFKAQPQELDTRVNVTEQRKQAETQILTLPPLDNLHDGPA